MKDVRWRLERALRSIAVAEAALRRVDRSSPEVDSAVRQVSSELNDATREIRIAIVKLL